MGCLSRGCKSHETRGVWSQLIRQGGEEDSDAEEDDQTLLQTIEGQLLQYDPKFNEDETYEGRAHAKNALINAFVRGGQEGKFNPEDMRMNHQLHLNVERIRVPEAFFQPDMFGQDYAGIGELAGWIMNGYDEDLRRRMMQVSHLSSLKKIAHRTVYLCNRRIIHVPQSVATTT